MNILINVLLGIYVLVALLMVLVILMQRPKAEGLGAAFGGGMTENLFGAQTTNVLTKFTGWLAGMFFLLTFILSILYAHKGNAQSNLHNALSKGEPAAPAAAALPSASPGPSSAVGPPGTITNLNPTSSIPDAAPASTVKPADLAVGAVPAGPEGAQPIAPANSAPLLPNSSASPAAPNSPAPKP